MAKTAAERMREYRKRQAGARRDLATLREENGRLAEDLAAAEASLEQARDRYSGVCREHGTALACPQCHGGGEYA